MNRQKINSKKITKTFVVIALLCAFMSLYFTYLSIQYPPFYIGTRRYIFENIATGFMIAYYAIGVGIIWAQGSLYWPFLSKKERKLADERQLNVRQRVYERAYVLLAVFSVLAIWTFNYTDERMGKMLWAFVIGSYFTFPALIAAWQKDS